MQPLLFQELWEEAELRWASTLYDGALLSVRERYMEIERKLEHEPPGPRRSQLVSELYGLADSDR